MTLFRFVFVAASVLALAACGGSGPSRDDDVVSPDVGADATVDPGADGVADLTPFDLPDGLIDLGGHDQGGDPGPDADTPPLPDVDAADADGGAEISETCLDEPGSPYCPCSSNDDCLSAYCVFSADGRVCAESCTDQCPNGWTCRNIASVDPVFVCVPSRPTLCNPCNVDADCASEGFEAGLLQCRDYGLTAGRFCGGPCGGDWDGDLQGDACDPDVDGDGVLNGVDTCPFVDDKGDSDGDLIPEACEIQWAGLAWPNGGDNATANSTFDMYLQVYKPGSTTVKNVAPADIVVRLRYKKEGGAWSDAVALYNVDLGNNKEYKYTIPASFLTPGGSLVVEWLPTDVTGGPGYGHVYGNGISDKANPAHWQPFTYPIW